MKSNILISPKNLSIASLLIAFTAILFPKDYYEKIIGETNHMHMDWVAFIFVGICILSFNLGIQFSHSFLAKARSTTDICLKTILAMTIVSAIGLVINIHSLLTSNDDLLLNIINSEGWKVKQGEELEQTFALVVPFALGTFWLWMYSYSLLARTTTSTSSRLAWLLTGIILLALISISSTLRLSRGELMPVVVGGLVMLVRNQHTSLTNSIFQRRLALTLSAGVVVGIFFVFSMIRGSEGLDVLLSDVVGYTLASFNRLSLITENALRLRFSGTGVYISSFLSFNATFNSIIPFAQLMEIPNFQTVWSSEFISMGFVGLNENLIWSTAYGYVFSDIGWGAPLYFGLIGVLSDVLWRKFLAGDIIGVILYPWVSFCILFWFGVNYIFDTKFVVLIFCILTYIGLSHMISRKSLPARQ